MRKFKYKAKNIQGETVSGLVEAVDQKRAVSALQERSLVVFSLQPVEANLISQVSDRFFRRISPSDLATFTRQLSTMITTGLTIDTALSILREQTSPTFGAVIDDILRSVQGGASLAEALGKHPDVFSRVYVALVRAGEEAGVLDQILARLADNLERQREFSSKIKGAMIYPVVIVIGMVVVGAIMMIFVIPKLLSLYQEFKAKLPTPTLILIKISDFMVAFWWVLILLVVGGLLVFRNFSRTPFGRRKMDELTLHLPVIGGLQTEVILTEMTRTLGLLVGAGISIIDALNITSEAVGNTIFEERLKEAAKQVEKGGSLAAVLSSYEEFPTIIPQMVAIGEETGKMDEVLLKVSRYFGQESEEMVKGLTTLIEPIIMIILGLGVGFLVVAIILPIYNLTSQF